jgi:hypothetical protein
MMEQAGTMFDDLGLADERGRVAIDIAARALNDGDDERAARQAAESVRLGRALGNRHGIGVALANEAAANALLGRMAEARGLVGEAAAVFDEIGEIHGMLFLLEIATLIEALERPGPLAARMAGSVDAAFDVGALTREPSDERIRSRTHEALTALGREEREAAFAAGATMDPRTMAATWLAEPVDP